MDISIHTSKCIISYLKDEENTIEVHILEIISQLFKYGGKK